MMNMLMGPTKTEKARSAKAERDRRMKRVAEGEKVGLEALGAYENVLNTFRRYSKARKGVIVFKEFHALMKDLNHGNWTEADSDKLFQKVDWNKNGSLDVDEFVNYIFGKEEKEWGGHTDYEKVIAQFRKFDTNRNGSLDEHEFTRLMSTLNPGSWTPAMTQQVFARVDRDRSGEVDLNELVAYLFGVNKDRVKAARRQSLGKSGDNPLVVIDMTCGKGGPEQAVQQISNVWAKEFGKDVVVRKHLDPNTDTITRVSARDDEVVFWDASTMVCHRENPFLTFASMKAWVTDMKKRHIPRLIEGSFVMADY